MPEPSRAKVVVLAGPSGSGKSHLARLLGWPVVHLDDFYHDHDAPNLPQSNLGITDWDHPDSWNLAAALSALTELSEHRSANVPVYDISTSSRVGSQTLRVAGDFFIAEGLFAPDIVQGCKEAGILADAICLRRSRTKTFFLRLFRDFREARKPPMVLIRRGWALAQAEPTIVDRAVKAGCTPMTPREARRRLRALAAN